MPSNENGSAQVICPYYKARGEIWVCCESLVNGTSTRLIFRTREALAQHMWQRCRSYDYWKCPQAAALDDLYDDEGRRD